MITINCSGCNHSWEVNDNWAGKRQRCPSCYRLVSIPAAVQAAAVGQSTDQEASSAAPYDSETESLRRQDSTGVAEGQQQLQPAPPCQPLLQELRAEFETALKDGKKTRIEDFLGNTREPQRTVLLRELLNLELIDRARRGEIPKAEDYWLRFPDHVRLISSFFPKASAADVGQTMPEVKTFRPLQRKGLESKPDSQEETAADKEGNLLPNQPTVKPAKVVLGNGRQKAAERGQAPGLRKQSANAQAQDRPALAGGRRTNRCRRSVPGHVGAGSW